MGTLFQLPTLASSPELGLASRSDASDWLTFALPSEAEAAELPLTRLQRGEPLLANRTHRFAMPSPVRAEARCACPETARVETLGGRLAKRFAMSRGRFPFGGSGTQFSVDFAEGWRLRRPLAFRSVLKLSAHRPFGQIVHKSIIFCRTCRHKLISIHIF